MKVLTFIYLFLITPAIAFSQSNKEEEFKEQLANMMKRSNVSTYTMQYFTDVAKYTFGQISPKDKWETRYQIALKNANTNADRFTADFQRIISQNKEKSDKDKVIFKTVEYSGRVIMSPIESIPIWGTIQKEINNQIFQAAENELTLNYKKKLAYSLEKLKNENQKKYNSIIKSGNYEEVMSALNEVNFFSNSEFSNVGEEYKEIIEKSQKKFLQESIKNTFKRIITDFAGQQIEIREIDKNITKLSQFTYRFAEESNKRFNILVRSQESLNKKVEKFFCDYKSDKKALDFMQVFLYSKMNTKERIAALKAGLLSNLSEFDRGKMAAQLELEVEKEKVIETAQDYLNTAKISIKILGDLSFGDSKLVQDISEAMNIGQAAISAVNAFTSGSYLEAISSITGLFAKKGPNIAVVRHKQIMQRLDRIDANLGRIENKIDQLIKGQEEMLKLQIETYNNLVNFSKQIDDQHGEVMKRLTVIENALYVNRQLIVNEWKSKCEACLETMKRLDMDIDEEKFPDWNKLNIEYVTLKEQYFKECEKYLMTYVFSIDRPSVNPYFSLTSILQDIDKSESYSALNNVNKESFSLLFDYNKPIGNIKNTKDLLYSLFFPSTSIKDLNQKIEAEIIINESKFYPTDPNIYTTIISPQASERHGYVVRNIGFLIGLTNADRHLISWEMFTDKSPPSHRNPTHDIENAISLNNVAIAQQSILAGEILLPIIFNEAYNYQLGNGDTLKFKVCQSLLIQNGLLATNYSNYFVGAHLQKEKYSDLQYWYAYNLKDSIIMSKVIKSPFPVAYIKSGDIRLISKKSNEGWYLIIGESLYQLPDPTQLNKLPLIQTQYLSCLLNNREKLYQHLYSYNAYEKNTSQNLNYLIMKN
jgi:hypothetical protein